MKILAVFGTRPEAIKMCPLIKKLRNEKSMECCVCLTGQHMEMLAQVMHVFRIREDYNLKIMKKGQGLTEITINIISRLEEVAAKENPELILVHGDTSTAFAGALVGFYLGIPVGHVEAGLRTYNMKAPYPEEFNRQVVDLIAELYFAPTEEAKENLLNEGKSAEKIFVTGNTVIDALRTTVSENYENEYINWSNGSRLILFTAHRRENIGTPMRCMFRALQRVVQDFPDVKVLYPIHKNPAVREIAEEVLGKIERVRMIEPLDVIDFHNFMAKSYLILTDSGGVQEEAPSMGKPVLVMRETTERPEGVEAGTTRLIGTGEERIYQEVKSLLEDEDIYQKMSRAANPYGDGHASERIIDAIKCYKKGLNICPTLRVQ